MKRLDMKKESGLGLAKRVAEEGSEEVTATLMLG